MEKPKTTMKVVCAWHKQNFGFELEMGTIDGKGQTGTTSGMCKECARIAYRQLPKKPPARWNLIGRFLERRRAKKVAECSNEIEDEDDLDQFKDAIEGNPGLHSFIMLLGQRFCHYLSTEDLARVIEDAKDKPETKCLWN